MQGFPVQTQLLKTGGAGAGDEHVRLLQHVVNDLKVLFLLQVEGNALFAAVEDVVDRILFSGDGHAHGSAVVAAGVADGRCLNFYNTSTHSAQETCGGGGGPVGCHFHNEQAFKGFFHCFVLRLKNLFYIF